MTVMIPDGHTNLRMELLTSSYSYIRKNSQIRTSENERSQTRFIKIKMEDQKNNQSQQCGEGCKCWTHGGGMCCSGSGCGWHGGHRLGFMILRCLLAVIILAVVFSLGVKIGELKGAYEYGAGYPVGVHGWGGGMYQMMDGYPQGYYYQSAPMMRAATSTK
jgi:hypothetical protein